MKSNILGDLFLIIGIALMATGAGLYDYRLSLIIAGATLCGLGLASYFVKR